MEVKMKKLILILSVLLVGCSYQKESENIYKDGTYETSVDGYGGTFKMEVVIEDDKIKDVVVGENDETPSIGGVAIEQLISEMKEKQSSDIDVVSGATKTSQAMINDFQEILDKAKN
jgi:uncharacterized protein with FMN-binding domain